VPWLREGLQAGEDAALVCTKDNAALAAALGQDPRVLVLPWTRIYRGAVDAVAFYHDLVTARVAAGRPRLRLVGEVGFDTATQGHDEWSRFEAVCNHALAPLPLWSLCACDTQALPRPLLDAAGVTRPWLRGAEKASGTQTSSTRRACSGASRGHWSPQRPRPTPSPSPSPMSYRTCAVGFGRGSSPRRWEPRRPRTPSGRRRCRRQRAAPRPATGRGDPVAHRDTRGV
jgi:hypothetical protein